MAFDVKVPLPKEVDDLIAEIRMLVQTLTRMAVQGEHLLTELRAEKARLTAALKEAL